MGNEQVGVRAGPGLNPCGYCKARGNGRGLRGESGVENKRPEMVFRRVGVPKDGMLWPGAGCGEGHREGHHRC